MGIVEPADTGCVNSVSCDGVARLWVVVPAGTAGDPRDDEPPEPPPPPTLSAGQFRASLPTFRQRPGRHPLIRWFQHKHGGGRR